MTARGHLSITEDGEQAAAAGGGRREEGWRSSYLEGAAVAVELTAHLSFGALVLMGGELQEQTQA